jgi:hypothetical protein
MCIRPWCRYNTSIFEDFWRQCCRRNADTIASGGPMNMLTRCDTQPFQALEHGLCRRVADKANRPLYIEQAVYISRLFKNAGWIAPQ